jgi:Tol biopolymer transport system component
MNADGSDQTRLTTDPALDRFPMFSPDGSRIAFTSRRDGNTEIYVMNADGSDQTDLTNLPGGDSQPNWSPDGRRIAWRRSGLTVPESGDIWMMNADGSGKTQLTSDPADELRPAWSPSGAKVVFRSLRTNQGDIYRMKADGTKVTQLTDDPVQDAYPDWQPLAGGSDDPDERAPIDGESCAACRPFSSAWLCHSLRQAPACRQRPEPRGTDRCPAHSRAKSPARN